MTRYFDRSLTPVQGSMLSREDVSYGAMNMTRLFLGIVLGINPSDSTSNRSARDSVDFRGCMHTCTVLIVKDGVGANMILRNVVVLPKSPSGIDSFEEQLPRPTQGLVSGALLDETFEGVDYNDLDGDWCVVGFIGGHQDAPVILSYWPHPANTKDVSTSGLGNKGRALPQLGRYFRRLNGVETTVTTKGDVHISTTYANSKMDPSKGDLNGRMYRSLSEEGGSVRLTVKPTQSLEVTFCPETNGIGTNDSWDPEWSQTNPSTTNPTPPSEKPNSNLFMDGTGLVLSTPGVIQFTSEDSIINTVTTDYSVVSKGTASISASSVLTLEGSQIKLGENALLTEPAIKAQSFMSWLLGLTVLTPFGPLPLDASYISTLVTSPAVSQKTIIE